MANRSDLSSRVKALLDSRQQRGRAGAALVAIASAAAALVSATMSPLIMVAAQSHVAPALMPQIQMAQVQEPPVSHEPKAKPAVLPKFDAASIKLNKDCGTGGRGGGQPRSAGRLRMNCVSVQGLIRGAYVVKDVNGRPPARGATIEGSPAWAESDLYAIDAEADGAPGEDMMRGPMMQALLQDRFHLKIHRD